MSAGGDSNGEQQTTKTTSPAAACICQQTYEVVSLLVVRLELVAVGELALVVGAVLSNELPELGLGLSAGTVGKLGGECGFLRSQVAREKRSRDVQVRARCKQE